MPEKIKLVLVVEDSCIEIVETNVQDIEILIKENDQEQSGVHHYYTVPNNAFRFDPTSVEFDKVQKLIDLDKAKEKQMEEGYRAYLLKVKASSYIIKAIAQELGAQNYSTQSGGMNNGQTSFDFDDNLHEMTSARGRLVAIRTLFPTQIGEILQTTVLRKNGTDTIQGEYAVTK